MTLLDAPKLMTVDEFLALPDAGGLELVDGTPVERKPIGAISSLVAARITRLLGNYVSDHNLGHVFDAETTYRCFADPRTGRRADVSFISKERLPLDRIPEGAIEIPADLVVEVVSPTDLAYDVEAKSLLYLSNGFRTLWVAYPITRSVYVLRPGRIWERLTGNELLRGDGALAGFSVAVSEFFPIA